MKTEFLKDENSNVWLSQIKDIHTRKVGAVGKCGLGLDQKQINEAMLIHEGLKIGQLRQELNEFEESIKPSKDEMIPKWG